MDDPGDNIQKSKEGKPMLEKVNFDAFWNYVHAFGRACDFIGKNFGDQALRQFFVDRGRETKLPRLKEALNYDGSLFMQAFCQGLNNIGSEFTLEENDKEIVVRGTCNTGGRYVREEQGASNERNRSEKKQLTKCGDSLVQGEDSKFEGCPCGGRSLPLDEMGVGGGKG